MAHLIAPSILTADFSCLKDAIDMINRSQADWFHIDVMDGVFVPNISIGFPVIKHIKKHAKKPLDVHLMIIEPERYLERFRDAGADIISIHYEACKDLGKSIQTIKSLGAKAGVVLNPLSKVESIEDNIKDADMILIMSVNPGFGGQKFIETTYSKISSLKQMIIKHNSPALIEVDGGVSDKNASALIKSGADILVAGNYIFSSPDPLKTISVLKNLK